MTFTLPIVAPPGSAGMGGFGITQAHEIVKDINELVESRMRDAIVDANNMRKIATDAIDELKTTELNLTIPDPPPPPDISGTVIIDADPTIAPMRPVFEDVVFVAPDKPQYVDIPEPTTYEIPEFTPTDVGLRIPTAPADPVIPSEPVAPVVESVSVDVPTPTLTMPVLPVLTDVDIPDFDYGVLPVLTETPPDFDIPSLNVEFGWDEPDYRTVIIDDVVNVIRDLWSGRLGIPPYIETAMWERAVEREDLTADREIASTITEYATKGFSVPPGIMAKRTDDVRAEHARRRSAINREVTIEVAKIHVENTRFAVTQGLAAENVYYNIFHNAAQRMFEAEKARVEMAISVYNTLVSGYNAKVQLFQAQIASYTTRLQAMIDVYKARVQGAVAKSELNSQRVQVYSAQIQALNSTVGLYEAQIRAVGVKLDAAKTKVEMYRSQIQAYADRLNAARLPFDIYKTRVDAETAKYGIIDAEARSYAALVSGRVSQAEVQTKYAELKGMVNEQRIRQYSVDIEAEKTRMQAQLQELHSLTEIYKADISRYEADVRQETALTELGINAQQGRERTLIAFYETQLKAYETRMRLISERTAQAVEAIKAAGSIASTLAAGAMAGINVGASLSGSGQAVGSGSSSYNESLSFQQSISESASTNTTVE